MKDEGVVKFQQKFTQATPPSQKSIHDLNFWRDVFYKTHLIGQDSTLYGGFGYGNVSKRLSPYDAQPNQRSFAITGTQTGGLAKLTEEHYALVHECYPKQNLVVTSGHIKASSESMTHGALYDLNSSIRYVFHTHSPHIWRSAKNLKIPSTNENVAYGTPDMADEVARLFKETNVREKRIFSMGGHEDGIISFGSTAREAGLIMLNYFCLGLFSTHIENDLIFSPVRGILSRLTLR